MEQTASSSTRGRPRSPLGLPCGGDPGSHIRFDVSAKSPGDTECPAGITAAADAIWAGLTTVIGASGVGIPAEGLVTSLVSGLVNAACEKMMEGQ